MCQAPAKCWVPNSCVPRQEYWSGLSFPPPGDLPNPEIEPESLVSPASQMDSLPLIHREAHLFLFIYTAVQEDVPAGHPSLSKTLDKLLTTEREP